MASGMSKTLKKVGTAITNPLKSLSDKAGHEIKEGWDDARGATKKRDAIAEAERIAAIPEAEATAGITDTESMNQRKGRRATRLVRSPLGGGGSLT